MKNYVTLTREQLYDLVWQKSVHKIAADFDISDVGLAKMCARHDIPTPDRGYWARPENRRPPRKPLPASDRPSSVQIPVKPPDYGPAEGEALAASAPAKAEREPIVVAEHLHRPCPVVQEARSALQGVAADSLGFLGPPSGCLHIRVTRAQLSRALRIVDALFKAFEKRGCETGADKEGPFVKVEGASFSVLVQEGTVTETKPGAIDLKSDSYTFHHNRFDTVRKPSGRLSITVEEHGGGRYTSHRRTWNDTDKHALESRLGVVFAGVEQVAHDVVQERRRKEELARQERERERQRQDALAEQARLRKELAKEKERVDGLLVQMKRWRTSQDLRLFIAHARNIGKVEALGLEGEALETWATWASQQADRLDPFVPGPPSVLDDEERIEHMCDHLIRRW